jgi:xanthine dehydrogenase molybdenum-binding subunit
VLKPDYKSNIVLSETEYETVGKRVKRHDATDKVTGAANYSADVHPAGYIHGKILRSPHAHAIINKIDTSKALELPGVTAIVTSEDFPNLNGLAVDLGEGAMQNPMFLSNFCIAKDKVLFKGHAVAGVAATSKLIAEQALELIKVDYEVLKPVLRPEEAIKPNAPILHEKLVTIHSTTIRAGGVSADNLPKDQQTNIANKFEFGLGDIEIGFKEADIIVEKETKTEAVHQGYIEPQTSTVRWGADGYLTMWTSSQGHFAMRDLTAMLLGIPQSKIKSIQMEIGGGFGGKTIVYSEPIAAMLSKKSGGSPVKITLTRTEVFEGTGPTSATNVKVKLGAKFNGKITAVEAKLYYGSGAFPGSPVLPGARCMTAPYEIPNAHIEGYDICTNLPKSTAYRAPGSPTAAFAMEIAVDELAEQLGIEPLEFRAMNGSREGSRQATGPVFSKIGFLETLQAAKEHDHYKSKLEGSYRGRGIASGFWFNGSGPSSAIASVTADGTINLVEGSPDIGGSRTVVSMQLAEVLGIDSANIKPSIGDTDTIGFTSVTGGSGVAFKTGIACYEAGLDIKRQMIERAAKIWDVQTNEVEYENGELKHSSDSQLRMSFKELAGKLNATGGPIIGRATVSPGSPGNAFATHIVDVEVDPDTGKVTILRYTSIQDAGKAIHPTYVEGQMQGGVAQGIGWALNEEYFYNEEGAMMNASFLDYRMPTALDLPMLDTVIVEVSNPSHPYGVRGVGEVCIVPPLAALSNAIKQAIGVRLTQLPMNPIRVLEAIESTK